MRRLLPFVAACLLLAACGGDAKHPSGAARSTATAIATPAPSRPRRGELAVVRRLARYGRPIFCGAQRGRLLALTFDDGPGPYTHYVLKRLRRNHMHATFF